MLIRLFWAFALLGATCMAQNANQLAHKEAIRLHAQALADSKTTPPPKTGNPNIDYKYDPNLPFELEGYDLSNYPFYNGLPDDLLDPSVYNFTCDDRLDGFYASVHHQCQVYHNCLFGLRYDFLCANYTVFDQKNFICHYVSLVDCENSEKHFDRNEELYVTQPPVTVAPQVFKRRPEVEVIYVDRPVRRQNRPRPNRPALRPFSSNNRRPPPPTTTTSQPVANAYDDYYYDDYNYYDDYYDDYYADEPKTTTTTTTQAPPPRRRRPGPQRTRLGQGRRPVGNRIRQNARPIARAQEDSRPLEQDISPVNKDTQNNEPEVRRPVNRRRPAARPNRPVVRNTTPADPFSDYYDYDNSVSDEPSIPTTTLAPVVNARRPSRPRINPRKPEPTNEEALLKDDQVTENDNSPSVVARERKPINGRRPFRPAPEESSSVPRRSGGGSVVNGRQRPTAEESSPREEAPAKESLGSGRRPGPSFPSRRKPTTRTQTEEPVNEEAIIEEDLPLAPGIELTADETIPEETPVEEESIPRSAAPGRRVRVGGQRRRPQRQTEYYYYDY